MSSSAFGSEVAMGVALAHTATVVAPLPVAVPPVLPALPPALMVVAAVAAGSPSWQGEDREGEKHLSESAGRKADGKAGGSVERSAQRLH